MTLRYLKLLFGLIFVTFIRASYVYGGRSDQTKTIRTPQGGSPVKVGEPTARDTITLSPPGSGQRDYFVRTRLSFGVDLHYPEFVSGPQLVEVSIHVQRWDISNHPLSDLDFKLTIAYYHEDTVNSQIQSNYELQEAYRILFRIDTIRVGGALTDTLPKNLFVRADLFAERYTELSPSAVSGPALHFSDLDCDHHPDGLHFSWNSLPGAEEYQLEFLHISNYGPGSTIKSPSELDYDFKHNATRIETGNLNYDIPLIFDRGWVAYRIRGVGVDINAPDHLVYGAWTTPTVTGTIASLQNSSKIEITASEAHAKTSNWQYSASYAEQGKRKEVISYYDGTLRNRQSVTKMNTEKQVIVGETIYDYQGRPAVNVLPVPVAFPSCENEGEPAIRYYPEFNKNMSGSPYSKTDFDLSNPGEGQECTVNAGAMATSGGASRYYSPSNPNQDLQQAYLPDAQGYPFQQIVYTPDNTGRIASQGGVGPGFQIGTGKETRFLYSNPNQLELNRMFGSEAGYKEHYQKNLVLDANGQVSVSYVDLSGRVVATALAGDAPPNLQALETPDAQLLEVNLILPDGSDQVIDELSNTITFSTSFAVSAPTDAVINYRLLTIPMTDSCLPGICVDCVYELELSLKDDCGADLLPDTLQHKTVGNFQQDPNGNYIFHAHCLDSTVFSSLQTVYLPIGKYTVSKKLSIKEQAMNAYLTLVDSSECVLTYQDFLDAEMQHVDSSVCAITCDNCLEQLGTLADFISKGQGTANEYYARVKECQQLCDERVSDCDIYLGLMQLDMSPGGQYAEYLNPSAGSTDLAIPLSVLNVNNHLPNPAASWRNPVLVTASGTPNIYADAAGQRSKIYLSENPTSPGNYLPEPVNNAMVQYDAAAGQYFIYPEQLQSVLDFIDNFEQSWALSLIKYHPEYCYYESCIQYENKHAETDAFSSSSFDNLLYNTHTFAQAQALGFITSSGLPSDWFAPTGNNPADSLKPWDPFVFYHPDFETGICAGMANKLVNQYNQFEFQFGQWHSMAEIAAYTIRCGSNLPSVPPVNCYSFGQPYNGIVDTSILNSEWRTLKALYMSAKQESQQNLAGCKAMAYCQAYNACIGNANYTPFPLFGYISILPPAQYYPFIDPGQPCSIFSFPLYRYKTKRFSNHQDALQENANSTAYELYLQTGQCPIAFALQHLLGELAQNNHLTVPSFNLNTTSYLSALFQANNSFYNPGALPSLTSVTTTTANTITANWNDGASALATLTLNKTAPQTWSQVRGLVNLYATGEHTFTAEATYLNTVDSSILTFPLTGSLSYFKLTGCTFEQECKSSQLALDLTTVFNVLLMDGNWESPTPVNLTNYSSTSMGSTVNLTSLYIQNAANSGSSLSFVSAGPGLIRIYNASAPGNNGLYIRITDTSGSLSSTPAGFNPITSSGNYSFEMEAQQAVGLPVTFSGVMYQIHNGDTTGIRAGDCGLPVPNSCQGQDFEVFEDLQPLLEDVLTHYNGTSNIDLYASIYTTPAIVWALPFEETHTTSTDKGDSLIISAGGCELVLTTGTSQYVQFGNLTGIGNFKLTGDLNAQSAYTHFTALGTFQTPSGPVQDTIYGTSCFSLRDCHPCPDSAVAGITALKQLAVLSGEAQEQVADEPQQPAVPVSSAQIQALRVEEPDCKETEATFAKCVDWFNAQSYPVVMVSLTASQLQDLQWCGCADALCDALRKIIEDKLDFKTVDEILEYLNIETGCKECYTEYSRYLECVSSFTSAYTGPWYLTSQDLISYETFQKEYECTCADRYCEILNTLLQEQIPFTSQQAFSQFLNYGRICKGCPSEYAKYLDAVAEYNQQTHTYTITPISEAMFVAYDYCNCAEAYQLHLQEILGSSMQFSNEQEFLRYVSLNRVCKNDQINEPENPCKTAYANYINCTRQFQINNPTSWSLTYLSTTDFDSLELCNCVDAYCSALDAVRAEIVTFSSQTDFDTYVFGKLDCKRRPPCTPAPASGALPEMPEVSLENECIAAQVNLAIINAQNAYNRYLDSIHTITRGKYLNHCLKTQEKLYTNYRDKQYQYMLYYYDQAGNLIKTVPPEGVELLPVTSTNDSLNIRINNDRAQGTKTVFTSHRLQTRYEYNSLNQLVAQYTPDTDPMTAFEQTLPNGLNNQLVTHKIQMVNNALGYLAGRVGERGYLYKTTDGGKTWSRVTDLVAAGLKKIVMLDEHTGIAAGQAGTVLKTTDGGQTWDMVITWNTPGMIKSVNDIAVLNPASSPTIMLVGDNSLAASCTNFTSAAPAFTISNSGLSGNVLSVEAFSGIFYATTHDPVSGLSLFFRFNGSSWDEVPDVRTTSFSDVCLYTPDKAYAVDPDGRIYNNTALSAPGSRWIHRSSNLMDSILKVKFFSDTQGISLVEKNGTGRLYRTIDQAKTWTSVHDSSYTAIAISKDRSVIAAVGQNKRIAVIFPYISGTDQLAEVTPPDAAGSLTAVWAEKTPAGDLQLIVADNQRIFHTPNALVANPSWSQYDYSQIGTPIIQIDAARMPTGDIYGVAITASGQAWKIRREGTPQVQLTGIPIPGAPYSQVSQGEHYFYLLSGASLRRVNMDASLTVSTIGSLPFTSQLIGAVSQQLLVASNQGELAFISLNAQETSILSSSNQTQKVYPDQINRLKKDISDQKLLAFGNDGLAYYWDTSAFIFTRISNRVNKHIYDAYLDSTRVYIVGQNGLSMQGTHSNYAAFTLEDIITASGQTLAASLPGTGLNAIVLTPGKRLYIAGENGTLIYSPLATGPGSIPPGIISQGAGDLVGAAQKINSENVLICGANGHIREQFGAMTLVNRHLFIPPITDIHFKDAASATLIAENFVARTTTNGGGNWNIVKPLGMQNPAATYDKVWTLAGGKSLLFGNGNALLYNANTDLTSTAFTASDVNAVARGTSDQNIFIADGNLVRKVDLVSLIPTTLHTLSGSNPVNALQVFSNGDHILVGNGGLYRHFTAAGTELNYTTGLSAVDFYDLAFADNLSGIIVGYGGAYYKTSNPVVSSLGYLQATQWQALDLGASDPLGVAHATSYTLALASSTDILIGGENPPAFQNEPYPYVRNIYDAGGRYSNRFWYDRLGRLVVSRNSRQEPENKYSYMRYDALGRIYEAGEKTENLPDNELHFRDIFGTTVSGYFNPVTIDDDRLSQWITASGARTEVTRSYYDTTTIAGLPAALSGDPATQRLRIVHVTCETVYDGDDQTFDHATHYSYDIHGNVKTLVQDNQQMAESFPSLAAQRFKQLDYSYDLISGNVHRMSLQASAADQWHHAYVYDADNRLRQVYTNTHEPLTPIGRLTQNKEDELAVNSDWQRDARYHYYDHGPLARIETGQNNLQGVDYYYNLQGWLKGVNSSVLESVNDPGKDGVPADSTTLNGLFAKDVFGFGLYYFAGDYTAISGAAPQAGIHAGSHPASNSSELYNGNIRYQQTTLTDPNTRALMPMLNAYRYDQLNRLRESRSYENGLNAGEWNPDSYTNSYFNAFTYDKMGNILTQKRHKQNGTRIENLTYRYQRDDQQKLIRNRLYHVNDSVPAYLDSTDIDDMGFFHSSPDSISRHNNYVYDPEGRLVKDRQEEIDTIIWTANGKVKNIIRTANSQKKNITFDYDAMGHRIAKHVYGNNNQTQMPEKSTYYVLDAQGNQLSMYEHKADSSSATRYYLAERNIYGTSRIGTTRDTVNMYIPNLLPSYGITGNRNYELTSHTGNVLAVISDRLFPQQNQDGNLVTVFYDQFTVPGDSLGWYYEESGTGNPPSAGYSLTFTGGEMVLTTGVTWENAAKVFDVPEGVAYTVSFDITDMDPVTDFLFMSDGDPQIIEGISSTGSYSFNGTGSAATELMAFVLVENATIHVDNVKLTYGTQPSVSFLADVIQITDYSPFGVQLDGRNIAKSEAAKSRYSFQGQEHDDEIKGEGNSLNFEYRMHDSRLGRFLSLDPLSNKYPWNSPYTFSENQVIHAVELEGLETSNDLNYRDPTVQKMTSAQKQSFNSGQRKAGVAGAAVVIDIFITRGWLSRALFLHELGSEMNATDRYHEAKAIGNEQSAAKYKEQMEAHGPGAAIGAAGEVAPFVVAGAMRAARESLAVNFYKSVGGNLKELSGINFESSVQTITLKKGTVVQQWVRDGGEVGSYFAYEGADAAKLGINTEDRTLRTFQLTEDVKVLQSKTKDIAGHKGGETQLYNPELKGKVKEIE